MTDRLREAVQAAVEVLEDLRGADTGYDIGDTVRCLRDALAEPPQDWEAVAADQAMTIAMLRTEIAALGEQEGEQEGEPVAWIEDGRCRWHLPLADSVVPIEFLSGKHPLYTAPPRREWVGLTNGDLQLIAEESDGDPKGYAVRAAIKAAMLKEKNSD